MIYSFSAFNLRTKEIIEWLGKELSGLRSGRATPAVLDAVFVEAYGNKMPVKHLATISLEGPQILRITPFDTAIIKEIERALTLSGTGLSVSADDQGLRAHFPELTGERRTTLIKTAKEKLENARITLRKLRDATQKEIEAKEKQGGMGEDERFRLKKELEKISDDAHKKLQEGFDRKEREILS